MVTLLYRILISLFNINHPVNLSSTMEQDFIHMKVAPPAHRQQQQHQQQSQQQQQQK